MERFLFVYSWLSVLTDGRFFRFIFSSLLRLGAIVLTIYLLGDAIENIKQMLEQRPTVGNRSLLLPATQQGLLLLSGYAIIHLILLRAAEIRTLFDPRYALSEIITVLNRLFGETLFVAILTSTALFLLQQMAPVEQQLLPQLQQLLTPWLAELHTLWIVAGGIGLSFVTLVAGYLSSEVLEMVMRLSRNSDNLSQQ